jgi:hypothetical protein
MRLVITIIGLAALVTTGCGTKQPSNQPGNWRVEVIAHSEQRAVADANLVLRDMYLRADYEAASAGFAPAVRQQATPAALRQIANQLTARLEKLTVLEAEAFEPIPGQRAMSLFYRGTHARGTSYHRIVVTGDASGYRVSGVFFRFEPYPENKLRKPLPRRVLVR